MAKLKKGFIHIYAGDGKGKTTAGLGLCIRALGAGLKVYILQFLKKGCYNELNVLKKLKGLEIEQFGTGCFIKKNPKAEDLCLAQKAVNRIHEVYASGKYDVVVLDELSVALFYKLIKKKDVLAIIRKKPKTVELIITGRKAPAWLIDEADLVTEMKEIKHYYKKGVKARQGIEC